MANVDETQVRIKREGQAHGSITLFLRAQGANKVLVVERSDDERMICNPRFLDDLINLGLAGKVGKVELAAADRFYIWQRGPDKVFDIGLLCRAHSRSCLLKLVRAVFPKIGD